MADPKGKAARTTIKSYEEKLGEALASLEFETAKLGGLTIYRKPVGDGFEIYLYAGAYRKYGGVFVDPVLHLDYLPLKRKLESKPARIGFSKSYSACNFGIRHCGDDQKYYDEWDKFNFIEIGAPVCGTVKTVVWTLENYALPLIMKYTTKEALRDLYNDAINLRFHKDIVTMDEEYMLAALDEVVNST